MIDLTKKAIQHSLIPQHSIVPSENVQELLVTLGIKLDHLPQIVEDDPSILHLEPKRNDVIKIERASVTAGKTVYYRVVK